MNDLQAVYKWRLEAIKKAIAELRENAGDSSNPQWAMFTLGTINAILAMTDDEVLVRIEAT